jgi:hypothetical protein
MRTLITNRRCWLPALAVLALPLFNARFSTLHAQGTAFTYQGQLTSGTNRVTGSYDLTFSLYETNTGGASVAGPVTNSAVPVTNGLFTVMVDFGAGVFAGGSNWLGIGVRQAGTGAFTPLTPLQQLTPAPYSIYAATAGSVALLNDTGLMNFFAGPGAGNSTLTGAENTGLGFGALITNQIGSFNTAAGVGSLSHNTNGSYNTASGAGALFFNTSGANNTAGGFDALLDNTTGNNNTASGLDALFHNTTGSQNTAAGAGAMFASTTGSNNVAAGFQAMVANTIGNQNVAYGVQALQKSTNDNQLVAVGYQALQNENAANLGSWSGNGENTAVGFQALKADTVGFGNSAVGYQALYANMNGFGNAANGAYALYNNTNGAFNVANGMMAILANRSGSYNVANGGWALSANTTGGENVAEGHQALSSAPADTGVVAIGFEALQNDNSTGNEYGTFSGLSENTGVGFQALRMNTNGQGNTALGFQALVTNMVSFNTAVGTSALQANGAGAGNTAVGAYALQVDPGDSANTAIGYAALDSNTNGTDNIAIGALAGFQLTSGSGNIYIGNNGQTTDNYAIRIGSQGIQTTTVIAGIYGASLSSGEGATPVFIDNAGHLGTSGANNSFTPTIGDSTHNFTTSQSTGYYTVVGNLVCFEIWLKWSSQGSAVAGNNLRISLPMAVVSPRAAFSLGYIEGVSFNSQLNAGSNGGLSYLMLYSLSNIGAAPATVHVGDCGSIGEIQVTGSYRWQ